MSLISKTKTKHRLWKEIEKNLFSIRYSFRDNLLNFSISQSTPHVIEGTDRCVNFNCHPLNVYPRLLLSIDNAWQMYSLWRFRFSSFVNGHFTSFFSLSRKISEERVWWLLYFTFKRRISMYTYTFEILDDWLTSLRMSIDLLNRYYSIDFFHNNKKRRRRKEFDWRSY